MNERLPTVYLARHGETAWSILPAEHGEPQRLELRTELVAAGDPAVGGFLPRGRMMEGT